MAVGITVAIPPQHGSFAMAATQSKNPFEQLGDLIDEGNARTLVIRQKERTLATMPLGYAILAAIAILVTAAPVLVVALVILHYTGGSIAVEGSEPSVTAPPAPSTQAEEPSAQA
jgi:Domain of unknown function (DUF4342)